MARGIDNAGEIGFRSQIQTTAAGQGNRTLYGDQFTNYSNGASLGSFPAGNGMEFRTVLNFSSPKASRTPTKAATTSGSRPEESRKVGSNESRSERSISTSIGTGIASVAGVILVVYGAVQGGDGKNLNVLGQNFDLSGLDTRTLVLDQSLGRTAYVEAMQVGDSLTATRVEIFEDYSTPGASPVLVYGNVSGADRSIGRFNVADLQIDPTTIGTPVGLQSGSTVSMPGTQPVLGGLILGSQDFVVDQNLFVALSSSEVI